MAGLALVIEYAENFSDMAKFSAKWHIPYTKRRWFAHAFLHQHEIKQVNYSWTFKRCIIVCAVPNTCKEQAAASHIVPSQENEFLEVSPH